jgi:hypothetical protein
MRQARTHIQRDFSGGAISPKMLMRQDTDVYKKSALLMQNYIPTPQGSARRAPGTRYVETLDTDNIRIIPYLTPANERSMVVLTPEKCDILFNVNDKTRADYTDVQEVAGTLVFRRVINENPNFTRGGLTNWTATPEEYTGADGFPGLGVYLADSGNAVVMRPRIYNDPGDGVSPVTLETTAVVDVATSVGTIEFFARYGNNWAWESEFGGYQFKVEVSDQADYSNTLYSKIYRDTDANSEIGRVFQELANFDLPTSDWTGTLYVKFTATAQANNASQYSAPRFLVQYMRLYANGESTITTIPAALDTPFTAEMLPDVQYVQSPYDPKQLVLVHPLVPPQQLTLTPNTGVYRFEEIDFENTPAAWKANNYPAACSAVSGRLVLAGGASFKVAPGSPVAGVSETVWATKVGEWDKFSAIAEVADNDSLEFTAIYRSPIQWVYGEKGLLVGAAEYEYAALSSSRQGVLAPSDLGVFLQSTHGSINVQPVGFGEGVLFPADGGTKVRALSYADERNGWVAQDLTLFNPEICEAGIVRMVRMRNPHQMCVVLLANGTLAIFHSESGISGWTTYKLNNAQIKDLCVVANDDGVDTLYMVVNRIVDDTAVTYLECIPNWVEREDWDYSESTLFIQNTSATATLTGLDHLEGKRVQVYDETRFVGNFTVESGSVTLSDDTDTGTTPMINARVGLQHRCTLRTLPIEKVNPGAPARFADFAVRIVNSTRPVINGERPPNRRPGMPLATSQTFEEFEDVEVTTADWNPYQSIDISEQAPFRNEVIGVYGTVNEGDVP